MEVGMETSFVHEIGKKMSKEEVDLQAEGYRPAYTEKIPGGLKVTYGKPAIVLIEGVRKEVLLLDDLPPEESLHKGLEIKNVQAVTARDKKPLAGSYGICDGRKFLAVSEKIAHEPKKSAKKAG
jgi:hypothetical protein